MLSLVQYLSVSLMNPVFGIVDIEVRSLKRWNASLWKLVSFEIKIVERFENNAKQIRKIWLRNWLAIWERWTLRTLAANTFESRARLWWIMRYLMWDRNWISPMRINWKFRLNGETNACDFQCRMFLLYLYRYLIVIYVSFHGTSMSPILMAPHDYIVTFYLLPYNAKVVNLIRPCIVYWTLCSMLFSERHLQYSVEWYDSRMTNSFHFDRWRKTTIIVQNSTNEVCHLLVSIFLRPFSLKLYLLKKRNAIYYNLYIFFFHSFPFSNVNLKYASFRLLLLSYYG